MNDEQIIIEPVVTEKSVNARAQSCYVFKVNKAATKVAVRKAVEKIFKVPVVSVNTCRVRAKIRYTAKGVGRTPSWKKAYVTLVAGKKIAELEA